MKNLRLIWLILLTIFCVGNIFGQTDKKNLYGILLDNTGSMRTQLKKIKELGKSLTNELNTKGQIAIFSFQTISNSKDSISELKVGLMWEQMMDNHISYIDSIETVGGRTTLYDAIFLASNLTKSKFERDKDSFSEKVLILITDGEDRVSKTSQKELIKFAKDNKIKVFAVGLVEELLSEGGFVSASPQAKAKEFLVNITKETNGHVIFPKSKQKSEQVIKDLFAENKKSN